MILRGRVSSRYNAATECLKPVQTLITARADLSGMCPGTLNIQLPARYLVKPDFVVTREEYGAEELRFVRCRIRGLTCWIMRPETHEPDLADVLEIVSEHRLRDYFAVNDGDEIDVEIDPRCS